MYTTARIVGAVVVILGLVAAAVTEKPLSSWVGSPSWELVVRLGLLGVAVVVGYLVRGERRRLWRKAEKPRVPATPIPDFRQVSLPEQQKDILAAISLVLEHYEGPAIALFVRMLTLNRSRLRITERAELLGSSVRTHAVNDYVMSAADRKRLEDRSSTSIPVPLFSESKGELSDNLDVTDGGSDSISLLSRKEAQGLVALALEAIFYVTFDRAAPGTPLDTAQTAALRTLQRIVSRPGRLEPVDDETSRLHTDKKLRADVAEAVGALASPGDDRLREFEEFCWYFAINTMVVADVPVPKGNRFVVKYSKTNPLKPPTLWQDRLRAARPGAQRFPPAAEPGVRRGELPLPHGHRRVPVRQRPLHHPPGRRTGRA